MAEIANQIIYFEHPGEINTERTLALARGRAELLNIKTILIATTSGSTGMRALKIFKGLNTIFVTHSTGFQTPNEQQLTEEHRQQIEAQGGQILTCQHAFGGVNRAIRRKLNTFQVDEIIAHTLRIFGEGMKVAFEISMMAADAGIARTDEPAIVIAGSGSGADTALVMKPANAQSFFSLEPLEIICIPSPNHPSFQ